MSYLQEQPQRRNLRCPHCHFDDLAFVTEYHRARLLRFLEIVFLFISVAVLTVNIVDIKASYLEVLPVPAILWLFFYIIRCNVESKTHVQAICRVCGEIWLLN